MPVRYTEYSAGPMTRRSREYSPEVVDVESSEEKTDYSGLTKDELASELESRGLPKSGKKAELVARLEEADG